MKTKLYGGVAALCVMIGSAVTAVMVTLCLLVAETANADPPIPPLPPASYQTVSRYVMIPMDDGVSLGATITFPSLDGSSRAPGRFPVVFSMTPYGRDGVCGCTGQTVYSSRGIIQAVVDVRGTGGSQGNLDGNYFSPREQRDGYDLVEWFGTQPWSTGKVAMDGGSYLAITQYLTAELRPPDLVAIAPAEGLSDVYRDAYTYDGIPDIFFDGQYIGVQGGPGAASGDIGEGGASGSGTDTDPDDLVEGAQETATAKVDQAQSRPIMFDYLARPNDDQWYHERSPFYRASQITVPVLIMDGWRDGAFIRGDIEMYEQLAQRPGVETRLYVDPCTHKGCGAPFDPEQNPSGLDDAQALEYEFLNHYLTGAGEATRSPVRVYMQPSGAYVDAAAWPPPSTTFTRFYLSPGSGPAHSVAGSLQPGTLTPRRPTSAGSESYFTNPTAGWSMSLDSYGTIAASPYMPTDQRAEEAQGLTWRTRPFSTSTRLIGPIQLHLLASSTANDTDWVAKLSDVAPDGSESIITEGALRASHRAVDSTRTTTGSPYHLDTNPQQLVPGRTYAFDIAIIATAYELAPGHSLQLRLTTDDLPTRLPGWVQLEESNPTGAKIVPLSPATNTVREGGRRASWLLLPLQGG